MVKLVGPKIGILAPTMHRYERRVPLTPTHVGELIKHHRLQFMVQRSPIRIFPAEAYRKAGATIVTELEDLCPIVFNVKQIPSDIFKPNYTYIFFAHVHKGQKENMHMLKTMMKRKSTLIDYERIIDSKGNRLVALGFFAGVAGMTDTLHVLGKRFESERINTPFSTIRQTIGYRSIEEIKNHMREVGNSIRMNGLPPKITPFIVGFTGSSGRVTTGATEIFDALAPKKITPYDLLNPRVFSSLSRYEIYKVMFNRGDRVKPKNKTREFSVEDFAQHPDKYESGIPQYLPFLTVFVHGAYWEPSQPRLISNKDLKALYPRSGVQPCLRVIGDISCDIEGGIQATVRGTKVEDPFFVFNPLTHDAPAGWEGYGPVINALETSPCEIAKEASEYFSELLKSFIPGIALADYSKSYSTGILTLPKEVQPAVILWNGEITEPYQNNREMQDGLERYGDEPFDLNY